MKHTLTLFLTAVFVLAFALPSCKKEVPPTLIITVKNKDGKIRKGAWVHVYPNNATQGTLNPEMEKEGYTDSNGEVRFDFKYSAVLDVDVIDTTRYFNDSTFTYVVDSVYGHKIVKIETRRQGSKENIFREEVVVK